MGCRRNPNLAAYDAIGQLPTFGLSPMWTSVFRRGIITGVIRFN